MTLERRPAATFTFGPAPPVDCQDATEMLIAETTDLCGRCAIHALPEIVAALGYAVNVDLRRLGLQERADCPRRKGTQRDDAGKPGPNVPRGTRLLPRLRRLPAVGALRWPASAPVRQLRPRSGRAGPPADAGGT